jgi:hypothetical protein
MPELKTVQDLKANVVDSNPKHAPSTVDIEATFKKKTKCYFPEKGQITVDMFGRELGTGPNAPLGLMTTDDMPMRQLVISWAVRLSGATISVAQPGGPKIQ